MHDTDHRFRLTVHADGETTIEIGYSFTDDHVGELVATVNTARTAGRCARCDHAAEVHRGMPADHAFTPARVTR